LIFIALTGSIDRGEVSNEGNNSLHRSQVPDEDRNEVVDCPVPIEAHVELAHTARKYLADLSI